MAQPEVKENPATPKHTVIAAIPAAARRLVVAGTKKTRTHVTARKIRETPQGTAAAKVPASLAGAANPKAE